MGGSPSFRDLVVATARQKMAASEARRYPDPLAEKPRNAIIAGLSLVAEALAPQGYVLSPSQLRLDRKVGDLTFRINIQSDRNNIAGQRAAIWVHPGIYSRKVSAWTRSHASAWIRPNAPFPLSFFGSQIGYFGEPHSWLEWDFAEPGQRQATAENLTDAIRRRVLPVFSVFEGPIEDVVTLFDHDWYRCDGLLTFLLAHGHDAIARKALARYFEGKPKDRVEFDAFLQKFAIEGLPPYRALGMSDLAAFAMATGFPWTTHVAAPERD